MIEAVMIIAAVTAAIAAVSLALPQRQQSDTPAAPPIRSIAKRNGKNFR